MKVGDRVKFKSVKEVHELRKTPEGVHGGWPDEMDELAGQTGTVAAIAEHSSFLEIKYDNGEKYSWSISEDMLEAIGPEIKPKAPGKKKSLLDMMTVGKEAWF